MASLLRQSTAAVRPFGPFVNKTDGVSWETGLVSALDHVTTGIKLSKNGTAMAVRNAPVTASVYDSYGVYRVALSATDTASLGELEMHFGQESTCLPVWKTFMVVPANVYDALVLGTDYLEVDALLAAAKSIWEYPDARTLTVPAAGAYPEVANTLLTILRGDTVSLSISGINTTGWTKMTFTAKSAKSGADTAAVIQIVLSNPAAPTTDGLKYIAGTATTTNRTNGSLTVNGSTVTIALAAVEAAKLTAPASLSYDLQIITASRVWTPAEGTLRVLADVTRATT